MVQRWALVLLASQFAAAGLTASQPASAGDVTVAALFEAAGASDAAAAERLEDAALTGTVTAESFLFDLTALPASELGDTDDRDLPDLSGAPAHP